MILERMSMEKIYEIKDIQKERIGLIKNETSNHGKRPKINLRRIINQIEQEEKEESLKIEDKYKITENELEEVTENYITKNWDDRTTDIVYKDKKYEGVFYLIEHQTEINYSMAQRIAEYKNENSKNTEKKQPI